MISLPLHVVVCHICCTVCLLLFSSDAFGLLDSSKLGVLEVMTPTFDSTTGSNVDVEAFLLDDTEGTEDAADVPAGLPSVTVVKGEDDEDDE